MTTPAIVADLAPGGTLRVAINLGNAILAGRRETGELHGVSVDLATALAARLGVPLAMRPFGGAARAVAALRGGEVDLGFFAIDAERSAGIFFTPPYLLVDGAYLVRADSPLQDSGGVDAPGTTVVVGAGSAYDLFLTRHLRACRIERAPSSQAVVDHFMREGHDVAAGVRQQLLADMRRHPGTRLLDPAFMSIRQAIGVPARIAAPAQGMLGDFIDEMRRGFVGASLARHGIEGVAIA